MINVYHKLAIISYLIFIRRPQRRNNFSVLINIYSNDFLRFFRVQRFFFSLRANLALSHPHALLIALIIFFAPFFLFYLFGSFNRQTCILRKVLTLPHIWVLLVFFESDPNSSCHVATLLQGEIF